LLTEIIYTSFKAANRRLGFLEISLAISTFTNFFEKICIKKARIIGQISINNWLSDMSDSLRMRILTEKSTNISNPG
jgi:hypothetical protein